MRNVQFHLSIDDMNPVNIFVNRYAAIDLSSERDLANTSPSTPSEVILLPQKFRWSLPFSFRFPFVKYVPRDHNYKSESAHICGKFSATTVPVVPTAYFSLNVSSGVVVAA